MMEQLKRYWEIAKLALLQEKASADSKIKGMNEHEKEFLPAVLEVTETPPSHAVAVVDLPDYVDVYGADFVVGAGQD